MSAGDIWAPGEAMTGKLEGGDHNGIHAFKLKRHALAYNGADATSTVFGEVALWGEIAEHELGYRAQYAKIVGLDKPRWMERPTFDELRSLYGLDERAPVVEVKPLPPSLTMTPEIASLIKRARQRGGVCVAVAAAAVAMVAVSILTHNLGLAGVNSALVGVLLTVATWNFHLAGSLEARTR